MGTPEGEAARCPCGTGRAYAGCCGPLHDGERQAATAEELMRSRYSAFVVGDEGHLYRTWHPRTRPHDVDLDDTEWLGLRVLAIRGGGSADEEGTVAFAARWVLDGRRGTLRETSHFVRRAGRWLYLDGVVA